MAHLRGVIWISHQSNFSRPVKSYPIIGAMSYRKLWILFSALVATAALSQGADSMSNNWPWMIVVWAIAIFFAFFNRGKTYSTLEYARKWVLFATNGGPDDLKMAKQLDTSGLDKDVVAARNANFVQWVYLTYIKPVVKAVRKKTSHSS